MKIAVLGLGEAGGRYAADLAAAGHDVAGYDPGPVETPPGVGRRTDPAHAVADVDAVFVLTPSRFSVELSRQVAPRARASVVWADFSSAAPAVMAEAGAVVAEAGRCFADVAVLGAVPLTGAKTDLLVSGPGADVVAEVFTALGARTDVVDGGPGAATARTLLRSVAMKGFAVVSSEAITAARAAGVETWLRTQISQQLAAGEVLLDRFLSGTVAHAERRSHEMRDAADYLHSLDAPAEMSTAAASAMERIAASGTS
ncbi:DUF1932 domain-containing protein [Amycolatopsis sp. FDAARGOS 1241]|uniref:DUF1932 domain-containing protein n=1 Tax=Amycolatopsis sp. FDAARGOS 1241 TaxID=2778070 RepID=UPI00194DDEA4|nr:DUF1932 domain-containing protein [Amycolatopsis sp. FDAARGOS 1241]QRP47901.1 NAD(P)-dependent oxidoreductase [Amycolatopsis sp. FDAARGOS 1241]